MNLFLPGLHLVFMQQFNLYILVNWWPYSLPLLSKAKQPVAGGGSTYA